MKKKKSNPPPPQKKPPKTKTKNRRARNQNQTLNYRLQTDGYQRGETWGMGEADEGD